MKARRGEGRRTTRIRTWRQGEVGLGATRRVQPGGLVAVGGSRGSRMWRRDLRDDRLLPLVEQIVYVQDIDDTSGWHVFTCRWLPNGRVAPDRLLAIILPVIVPPAMGPLASKHPPPPDRINVTSERSWSRHQIARRKTIRSLAIDRPAPGFVSKPSEKRLIRDGGRVLRRHAVP